MNRGLVHGLLTQSWEPFLSPRPLSIDTPYFFTRAHIIQCYVEQGWIREFSRVPGPFAAELTTNDHNQQLHPTSQQLQAPFLKTLKRRCIDYRYSACLRHLKFIPCDPQALGIMIGQFRGLTVPFGFHTRLTGLVGAKREIVTASISQTSHYEMLPFPNPPPLRRQEDAIGEKIRDEWIIRCALC